MLARIRGAVSGFDLAADGSRRRPRLGEELELLWRCLDIERIRPRGPAGRRHGRRAGVGARCARAALLCVQPLVENAIRHRGSPARPGWDGGGERPPGGGSAAATSHRRWAGPGRPGMIRRGIGLRGAPGSGCSGCTGARSSSPSANPEAGGLEVMVRSCPGGPDGRPADGGGGRTSGFVRRKLVMMLSTEPGAADGRSAERSRGGGGAAAHRAA